MHAYVIEDVCSSGLINIDTELAEKWPELQECQRADLSCGKGECENDRQKIEPVSAALNRFLHESTKMDNFSHSVMVMRPFRLVLNLLKKNVI